MRLAGELCRVARWRDRQHHPLVAVAAALLIWRKEFDWSQCATKIIFGVWVGLAALLIVGIALQR
jgi:hypothetical protein